MPFTADEEAQLRGLLDKQAIEEVVLRYCRGIDRMDEELVRSCYHPDATDEHGSFTGNVDEFLTWVWKLVSRHESTFHFVGNILIELEGDLASSESYGVSIHRSRSTEPARNLMVGFRYVDRFERRGGEWRIGRRVGVTEWARHAPAELQWPVGGGMRSGERGPGDVVYSILRDG